MGGKRKMSTHLTGKVAIVTGAAQGIGEGIAVKFASEGASVVVADVDISKANKVAEKINNQGGNAIAVRADVGIKAEVQNLIKATIEDFKTIHILVNNAGITRHAPVLDISEEDWDITLNVDLKSVMLCTQGALPYMIKNRYGKIVNISSIGGIGYGRIGMAAYASAKGGVIQLTKIAAREVGQYGINVNCICPGVIVTPMTYWRRTKEEVEKYIEERTKSACLRRTGTPEDIAKAALFLASDESIFITGQILPVDGGRTDGI
jgi:3-oxoacyl-[acyl-carrier protein] reductase